MKINSRNITIKIFTATFALFYALWAAPFAAAYAFNEIVPDVRQPASVSGGSACPVPSRQLTSPGAIAVRWSTALSTNPITLLTQNQTGSGQLSEIEQAIEQSFSVWASVSGTTLTSSSLALLTRISTADACGSDGIDSICFDQPDSAFTPGVLAFTRVITADHLGAQVGTGAPATQLGQILDADIYLDPSDSTITFATPAALPGASASYDLESILTHEIGPMLGFSHSAVWDAMMYPYAAAPGTYTGQRPTTQQPDAPLGDDDRTGLRVLYPDPNDTVHVGSIAGKVLPANPLSLPAAPPGVTGIFGAHVVAVNASTGAVIAGTIGGWSCSAPGPAQFDGSYEINHLAVGTSYSVYAEPLDGTVFPAQVSNALYSLCRNSETDPGWPSAQGCVVPSPDTSFTVSRAFYP